MREGERGICICRFSPWREWWDCICMVLVVAAGGSNAIMLITEFEFALVECVILIVQFLL